jgi:FAD/FMN-containing dehydrogenase
MFPPDLGAEGSAQVGGMIGTKAGGSHVVRVGRMADPVLGLEVVPPNGSVWPGLRMVQKDTAGFALRSVFCGADGTLGVVARTVLRLSPQPNHRRTALPALPDAGALEVVCGPMPVRS